MLIVSLYDEEVPCLLSLHSGVQLCDGNVVCSKLSAHLLLCCLVSSRSSDRIV